MKTNVLIIGAGAVAHVAAHKCAQNNDILGSICIASRKKEKCDRIIESVRRKRSLKDKSKEFIPGKSMRWTFASFPTDQGHPIHDCN